MIDYSKKPDWFYDPDFWRQIEIAAKKDLEEDGEKMNEEWKKQFFDSISGAVDTLIENVRGEVGVLTGQKEFKPTYDSSVCPEPVKPDGPSGDNWKERLSHEYHDTKVRYEKLNKYVKKKYAEWVSVGFFGNPSEKFTFEIQQKQLRVMKKYLDILEMRMALANIPF